MHNLHQRHSKCRYRLSSTATPCMSSAYVPMSQSYSCSWMRWPGTLLGPTQTKDARGDVLTKQRNIVGSVVRRASCVVCRVCPFVCCGHWPLATDDSIRHRLLAYAYTSQLVQQHPRHHRLICERSLQINLRNADTTMHSSVMLSWLFEATSVCAAESASVVPNGE